MLFITTVTQPEVRIPIPSSQIL